MAERLDIGDDVERLQVESLLSEYEKNAMLLAIKLTFYATSGWRNEKRNQYAEIIAFISMMPRGLLCIDKPVD